MITDVQYEWSMIVFTRWKWHSTIFALKYIGLFMCLFSTSNKVIKLSCKRFTVSNMECLILSSSRESTVKPFPWFFMGAACWLQCSSNSTWFVVEPERQQFSHSDRSNYTNLKGRELRTCSLNKSWIANLATSGTRPQVALKAQFVHGDLIIGKSVWNYAPLMQNTDWNGKVCAWPTGLLQKTETSPAVAYNIALRFTVH